jgi:hypothetical protein
MPRWSVTNVPRRLRWIDRRRRIRRKSIENGEIEAVIKRLDPDLLLIDIECHFAVIATARLGIATVLPMFWFCTFRQPGLPPLHTSMMPSRLWHRRLAIRAAWWWLRLVTIGREWSQRISRRGMRSVLRPVSYSTVRYCDLKAVARSRGYALGWETDRTQWLRPYMYRRLPILCFNAWGLEFPHTPHPNLHYVGPMINQHRPEVYLNAAGSSRWERFKLDHQQEPNVSRPIIYCSLGTYWSADRDFLRRVLQVFERRKDWDLVLGLGGKLNAGAFAPVPSNAVLLDWAPQLEVLQLADCAITHGGITTINECIYCRVPMVVYSTKRVDQNGCAARVAFHKLGIMADKDADTTEQIERNIERTLSDPTFRQNLATMQSHFLADEQANSAVRVLDDILTHHKSNP